MNTPTLRTLLALVLGVGLVGPAAAFVDSDTNGMDDTWEMIFFGTLGNDPNDDADHDGRTNLEECNAATNPLDPQSNLRQVNSEINPGTARIAWTSVLGKKYRLQFSTNLQSWPDVLSHNGGGPVDFFGNGGQWTLDLSNPASPVLTGGATREVWLGTGGSNNVNDFKTSILNWTDSDTPAAPEAANPASGTEYTVALQAPTNYGDQYAQRLRGFITAPEAGDYTFFISGRHQCEFWLSSVAGSTAPADLGRVLRMINTNIITPENWTHYADNGIDPDDQKSAPVTLAAGGRYYFEVLHRHNGQEDHLAIGWTKPSDAPGTIEVIPGGNVSPIIDLADTNAAALLGSGPVLFARVLTFGPNDPEALQSDGDGIDDATENLLAGYSPFDSNSTGHSTGDDSDSIDDALAATTETISVAMQDAVAREDNGLLGNGSPRMRDVMRFRLTRVGSLKALPVFYTIAGGDDLVGGDPQEENHVESSDYSEEDVDGNPLSGSITFPAGATEVQVVIDPVNDGVHEYPETISMTLDGTPPEYAVDPAAERVEGLIYDQRDEVENEILFVGFSQPQPGSTAPQGSAICSGKLNANKDTITLFTDITAAFSSPQINSHIHKDIGTPGSDPVVFGLPQVGEIGPLEWPLHQNQIYTPQLVIDSLFNQVGETTTPGESKVYINWHTVTNPAGELYAFLEPAVGTIEPEIPDDPPAITQFDPVTEETELRREITRFLIQSTFGPTPALVDELYNRVVAEPGNDRIQVFSDWIDEQLDESQTPQSQLLSYSFAADWQEWVHRGYFDATYFEQGDWGSDLAPELRDPPEDPITAAALPTSWPSLTAHDPDAIDYADINGPPTPTGAFPLANGFINEVYRSRQLGLGRARRESPRRGIWTNMMNGGDQVRQRLAFAWSQILVISAEDPETYSRYYGRARYWDMLAENSDDTFREMLEGVTYSPMMGQYLSLLKNRAAADLDDDGVIDVFPDENYAREIMQLFSIGLVQKHLDGTLALDPEEGLPQATYDNNDITELSRVMTGLSFGRESGQNNWNNPNENNNFGRGNSNQWYGSRFLYPMKMFGGEHDLDPKTIVGGLLIDNSDEPTNADHGNADLADVHDWLAGSGAAPYDGYPSTAPFLARRLIQRLVTSNPPRDYVYRVAKTFHDTGGDLKATSKAILLDYYARSFEAIDGTYGRKKPPLMAYVQLSRALGGTTSMAVSELGNGLGDSTDYGLPLAQISNYTGNAARFRYGVTNNQLSMSPMRAETVFNFYLPEYTPGGGISAAGMVAPEFQILNEGSAIANVNYFEELTWSSNSNAGQGLTAVPNRAANGYANTDDNNAVDRAGWMAKYESYTGAEWEKDQQLIDELDEILNAGWLQRTYTLDPADRTPAAGDEVVVDADQNPYEVFIDVLTESYDPGGNGTRDKVRLAFYLMSTTAPYQVQK